MTILHTAEMFKVPQENMPTSLLIVSDMQFTGGFDERAVPVVEGCMQKWEKAGYQRPKIVYWNVAGYAGSPATVKSPNTGLVSGFNASILDAVFKGEDFTPRGIMTRAIEKYPIIIPDEVLDKEIYS
jgi:Domain of unknown function (DUF2828)